jgi:organic radical activating enzyme
MLGDVMNQKRELFYFEWVMYDNCNLNCTYCVNIGEYSQKPKDKMLYAPGKEIEIANKIYELSGYADHVHVNLSGGEPLLSKHFIEVLSILSKVKNISINLITNLKKIHEIADYVVQITPNINIEGSLHVHFRSDLEMDQLIHFLNSYKQRLKINLSQVNHDLSDNDRKKIERIKEQTGMTVWMQTFIPPWTESGRVDNAQEISDISFVSSLGKRCCLGYSHFLLLPDGTFYYDLWCIDRDKKQRGNFIELEQVNFNKYIVDDMKKCPKTSCGCNYNTLQYTAYSAACLRLGYPEEEVFGPNNLKQIE